MQNWYPQVPPESQQDTPWDPTYPLRPIKNVKKRRNSMEKRDKAQKGAEKSVKKRRKRVKNSKKRIRNHETPQTNHEKPCKQIKINTFITKMIK